MIDYKKIFRNREFRLQLIDKLRFIPDKPYLKMVYWIKTGKKLNLKNPTGFNEKLNWLKLYDIHYEYARYVDKVAVRDYLKEKNGEDLSIPLLGVWEHYDDIDFSKLPEQFVLKCSHDSGSVKIVTEKGQINHKEFKKFFEGRLRINPFNAGREFPYKNVPPRIIAEEYMSTLAGDELKTYKILCFCGKPKVVQVITDQHTDQRFDYYDINFNHYDFEHICPIADNAPVKSANYEKMVEIAAKLSEGFPFVRVDLYDVDGKIYFSELTFFHDGGFYEFPDKYEKEFGSWIDLNYKAPGKIWGGYKILLFIPQPSLLKEVA